MPDVGAPSVEPADRFSIRPAVTALLFALVVTVPPAVSFSLTVYLIFLLVGVPVLFVGAAVFVSAACLQGGKRGLGHLLALAVLIATSVGMVRYGLGHGQELNEGVRWLLWSREYKHQLRTSPGPGAGLPHLEWDTWGIAGQDNSSYLVYDASDTMLAPPYRSREGKVAGVPCEVARVRRLEARWYIVMPYTNSDWDQCGGD